MRLDHLRTQALRFLAAGQYAHALRVYQHVLAHRPDDLESRTRVADVCVQLRAPDHAKVVYAAVASLDLRGGRPLHALVAMQALLDLGEEVAPLRATLVQLYGAGSPAIAKVGARLAPPPPDTELPPPVLAEKDDLAAALQAAVSHAAAMHTVTAFPPQLQPIPLLSEVSGEAFHRVLDRAVIQRFGHGALVIRAGDPGDAFYLLAAGQVRVFTLDSRGQQVELARLHEGALFGEMAIINAQPRSASIEVVGSADLLMFPRRAIQAAAAETPQIAAALDRFTRDRLVKNILHTSPLFRPFSPAQRLDLIRRFSSHEVAAGQDIIVKGDEGAGLYVVLSGEVDVVTGDPPFEEVLATLGPGELFGEISLLRSQPAMATVRASRKGAVLFLPRAYFERLLGALPEVRAFFEELTEDRLRKSEQSVGWDLFGGDDDIELVEADLDDDAPPSG